MFGKIALVSFFSLFVSFSAADAWGLAPTRLSDVLGIEVKNVNQVTDFTLSGDLRTMYFKKFMQDGKPYYKFRQEAKSYLEADTKDMVYIFDGENGWQRGPGFDAFAPAKDKHKMGPYRLDLLSYLAPEEPKYGDIKKEKVDGMITERLEFNRMNNIGLGEAFLGDSTAKVPGRIWVNVEDATIRKIELDFVYHDERSEGTTVVIQRENFRNVDGILFPFSTKLYFRHNYTELAKKEFLADYFSQKKELQKRLQSYTPEVRKSEEEFYLPLIEKLRKQGMTGIEEFPSESIKEVKVNTGLADSLFDVTQLQNQSTN